jgi:hypothetical protein
VYDGTSIIVPPNGKPYNQPADKLPEKPFALSAEAIYA